MSSVRETWGLACPKCGRDSDLRTTVEWHVKLTPDGYDAIDDDWNDAPTACRSCDYWGQRSEFNINESAA